MERKTLIGALIICVVLFIAAAVISGTVAQDDTALQGKFAPHQQCGKFAESTAHIFVISEFF